MIVLLNDDLMCAIPYATFLRSRRLGRRPPAGGLAMFLARSLRAGTTGSRSVARWLLAGALLARHGLLRSLAGAGVGPGALPVDGQASPVTQALVAPDLDLALDVRGDLAAKVTLDLDVAVDVAAQLRHLVVGQVAHPCVAGDVDPVAHLLRGR